MAEELVLICDFLHVFVHIGWGRKSDDMERKMLRDSKGLWALYGILAGTSQQTFPSLRFRKDCISLP